MLEAAGVSATLCRDSHFYILLLDDCQHGTAFQNCVFWWVRFHHLNEGFHEYVFLIISAEQMISFRTCKFLLGINKVSICLTHGPNRSNYARRNRNNLPDNVAIDPVIIFPACTSPGRLTAVEQDQLR